MIPFASQRGGGQDLATHLLNAYDNEMTELVDLRGAVADDLHGAFKEWEVQADTLTHCRKFLYSLSINPDPKQDPLTREQYMDYIGRTEDALGLKDQPRAIVFHTKYGREHCHVVWSRIDADHSRAVQISFDKEKLMRVTRAFALDHGLTLPKGYDKSRQVGQVSLNEQAQLRETGFSKDDHMRQVTEAWKHSDDARSFVQALAERGYLLATGKRPYLVVDLYGNANALPKLIDDKSVRTDDVRKFLAKDFPVEFLPTVEQAERLVATRRKLVERSLNEDRYATRLADLKHSQAERRSSIERDRDAQALRHQVARASLVDQQSAERRNLRAGHMRAIRDVRAARERDRPTGLAAFLGRVSGIELVRKALHHYADGKRLQTYREQRAELKTRQGETARALETRLSLQAKDTGRKLAALEKVERREQAAFMRDERSDQRVRDRDGDDRLPSLAGLHDYHQSRALERPDLLATFVRAQDQDQTAAIPDVMSAFRLASRAETDHTRGDSNSTAYENESPSRDPGVDGIERNRGKD